MTNRLRTEIEQEEEDDLKEVVVVEKPKKAASENPLMAFFNKISPDAATRALPFVLYLAFLGMIYIANMHHAEKNIRDIDRLSREVKELSWDYKSTKAEMAFKSTLSEVNRQLAADSLDIAESKEPAQKITVKEQQP